MGGMHCAALTHDSKTLTWGVNDDGALGRNTTAQDADADSDDDEYGLILQESTPIAVPEKSFPNKPPQCSQVVATDSATFALSSDGLVYGWGTFEVCLCIYFPMVCALNLAQGSEGTLGFLKEDTLRDVKIQETPTLIAQVGNVKMLAAAGNHVLALDHDRRVWTWGCGQQNQLGRRIVPRDPLKCLEAHRLGLMNIASIACGLFHSFAVDEAGCVYAGA